MGQSWQRGDARVTGMGRSMFFQVFGCPLRSVMISGPFSASPEDDG
jgi:hypothetical protein